MIYEKNGLTWERRRNVPVEEMKEFLLNNIIPEVNTGCWIWIASGDERGRSLIKWQGKHYLAHQLTYFHFKGAVSAELVLDHLCRNPWCVNPDHLEPVTQAVNVRRGNTGINNRIKTHCPRGHEYTSDNIYSPAKGGRYCLICKKENLKRWRAA